MNNRKKNYIPERITQKELKRTEKVYSMVAGSLLSNLRIKSSFGKMVAKTLISSLNGVTVCLKSVNIHAFPIIAANDIIT